MVIFMMMKLIRSVVLVGILGTAIYYFVLRENNKSDEDEYIVFDENFAEKIIAQKNNCARKIEYKFKIPGGSISIRAKNVNIKSLKNIVLKNIEAIYTSNNKKTIVSANDCNVDLEQYIINLSNNIVVHSYDGMIIKSNECVVDINKQIASSESRIEVFQGKTQMEADGFIIQNDGNIILSHATLKKGG